MPQLPLLARAETHGTAVALRTGSTTLTYRDLLQRSRTLASTLLGQRDDLRETRIALLLPPGGEYVAAQWATWEAGGIVLPLCLSATEAEWEYALGDSGCEVVVTTRQLGASIGPLCQRLERQLLVVEDVTPAPERPLPTVTTDRRAMILYTSGTTSRPKGVVTTHANIQAQIESLVEAWEWTASDRIPLFLPLHHIHGIINVLCCALWSGAQVEVFPRFDAEAILRRVRANAFTVFMAVPTIYVKLIQAFERAGEGALSNAGFARMRLMVSGSAALPAGVHLQWYRLTGQALLERYGMTEIGMALSNPYRGELRPGAVGVPLPGVEVRLVSESGQVITGEGEPGEIQVRGPGVFREYWNRPDVTAESFAGDWFRTGDVAVIESRYYRIMGRLSVDIIKSGGYKLSALEIESILLDHPRIRECAVIGLPDDTWGEAVAAVVALEDDAPLEPADLSDWCRQRMSPYKVPRRLLVVRELPRNAMGKVTKPAVRELFSAPGS